MAFQPEKNLAGAFQTVRPSEELVQKTEQAMHAALCTPQKTRKPKILRYASFAACAAAVALAVFLSIWQRWIPADRTGQPGTQLLAIHADLYQKAAVRTAVEPYNCASPSTQEMLDALRQTLAEQNHSAAGELIADGVCSRVEYYQIPVSGQPIAFLTIRLTAILHCENAPQKLKNGDQITVVCFPSDLPNPTADETTQYRFSLSTSADGNVYSSDDETMLAKNAWLLHEAWQQTAEAQQIYH